MSEDSAMEPVTLDETAGNIVLGSLRLKRNSIRQARQEATASFHACKHMRGVKLASARLAQVYYQVEDLLNKEIDRVKRG